MSEQRMPAARGRHGRPQRRGSLLSTVVSAAVTAVIVASAATAWLVERADSGSTEMAVFDSTTAEPMPQADDSAKQAPASDVVTAPPLRRVLPPGAKTAGEGAAPATNVMGGPPACPNCGVVETVVAVLEYGETQPRAFQMHIRMDNGTVRTIQHRGALPAGSRVAVEGSKLRALASP